MRVRCLGNDNMEWMRIELSIEDGLNIHGEVPNNPNPGLDVTAEIMHNSFLSNMPHLEEVNNTHKSIISEISDTIKSEKISIDIILIWQKMETKMILQSFTNGPNGSPCV